MGYTGKYIERNISFGKSTLKINFLQFENVCKRIVAYSQYFQIIDMKMTYNLSSLAYRENASNLLAKPRLDGDQISERCLENIPLNI